MTKRLANCKECEERIDIDNLRYSKDSNKLVCISCYKSESEEDNSPERVRFQCVDCSYRFSLDEESRIDKKCPYCRSREIIKQDELKAENIVSKL